MTYDEAMGAETTVTLEEARREIEKHGCSWEEFVKDCRDLAEYSSATVLLWLGY